MKNRRQIEEDKKMLFKLARFEKGVSVDPTINMSPEDAEKWERQKKRKEGGFRKPPMPRR